MGDEALAFVEATGEVVELEPASTAWLLLAVGADTVDAVVAELDDSDSDTDSDTDSIRSVARHVLHGLWASGVLAPIDPA